MNLGKPITAAISYVASTAGDDTMLRELAGKRVRELVAEKVAARVAVSHDLSPALPRDGCQYKPQREYVAAAELFVFTREELEIFLREQKNRDARL